MNQGRLRRFALILTILCLLSACTATKYLKEDQSFYAGSNVKFDPVGRVGAKKALKQELESLIVPAANSKVLGMRPGVWLFFRQRNDAKKKGLKAFIRRKFGEVPVLITDIKPEQTATLIEGTLQNNGYFKSEVTFEIKERKRKKESTVVYNVLLQQPYRLRNIAYPKPKDSVYARIVENFTGRSYLKEGQRYDLERLQAEQERIEKEVENFGLYYFDDRYLIFEADSTVGEKKVDIELKLEEGVPNKVRQIYKMSDVHVFPDYSLDVDTVSLKKHAALVDSFQYHDISGKFKPGVITDAINLRRGNIYRAQDHSLTLSHLMDLGVFKFVNIQYTEAFADSNLLNANIFLTPLKRRSLRGQFQAVSKSNSFAGPGFELTFTDRNFLHGAELFQLKLNTSYEIQLSKSISGPLNSFEVGIEGSLTIPRFISPIRIDYSAKKFLPKTDLRISYTAQNRVEFYRLNTFNLAAGYIWRESETKSHELYPIDVNYVKTGSKSEEFQKILDDNRYLQSSFEDQFIPGARYSYTLNTQLKQDLLGEFEERKFRPHSIYFNGTIQTAGNLANAFRNAEKHDSDGDGINELFNAAYSQFVRGDLDFRHYWQFDVHNKLASRLIVGTGYAYGNSEILPYIRQFSIGGSNSLRAFPARSIGPGTYSLLSDPAYQDPNAAPSFVDQRADIKLEGNVEFRFDIFKIFKGAVFVDAGNIWLMRDPPENTYQGKGKFDKDTFISELAVGTGVGFRVDLNFFVIRLDTAFPIRQPHLDKGERWVFDEIDFGSSDWRNKNIVFNLGIGYPF